MSLTFLFENYGNPLWKLCSSEAEALATELGIKFFRASVKENLNVTESRFFREIQDLIIMMTIGDFVASFS